MDDSTCILGQKDAVATCHGARTFVRNNRFTKQEERLLPVRRYGEWACREADRLRLMGLDVLARAHPPRHMAPSAQLPDLCENGVAFSNDVRLRIFWHRLARLGEECVEVQHECVDFGLALRC